MAIANNIPYSFTISYNDVLKGSNSYPELPDAAFSGFAGNVFHSPGLWGNIPDLGSAVTTHTGIGQGITSYGYGNNGLPAVLMAVGTNGSQDGYFYLVNIGTGGMTQVGAADTMHDYTDNCDTVWYRSRFLSTSTTDITRNNFDLTTRDTSYWVATLGQTALFNFNPHPQLVYADINYIADGQYLHRIDGATPATNVLDLGIDWVITAMTEYQGLMYIAAERYWNASGDKAGESKIVTWNSYSSSFLNEWSVTYRISSFKVFGRMLIVFAKTMMGYWDGAEIKFLRRIQNQIYKSHVTECDYSLWFVDRDKVVRYGYPLTQSGSTRRFYEYFRPDNFTNNSVTGGSIYSAQVNALLMTFVEQGTNFKTYRSVLNTPSTTTDIKTFSLSERNFRQSVIVRGAILETTPITANQSITIAYKDHTGTEYIINTFDGNDPEYVNKNFYTFDHFELHPSRRIIPIVKIKGAVLIRNMQYVYEPDETPTTF